MDLKIIAISIDKRQKEVPNVQNILTKYGENIHSRIGYHNVDKDKRGLIIVIYTGENSEAFCNELQKEGNVIVNFMEI